MKNIVLFISFLTISFSSLSQIDKWYGSDLSALGFKSNRVHFNKLNANANSLVDYTDSSTISYRGGSFELAADLFTEHVYFYIDGSLIADAGFIYFRNILSSKEKEKEVWFKKDFGNYDQTKFLPIRLAFGDNITPYFGLYGGGQWTYSLYKYTPSGNVPYRNMLIGGNQYGVGVHATLAIGPALFKQSYMYDWISRASHFKGRVIAHESSLYIGWDKLGVFGKINYETRFMKEGTYSTSEDEIFKNELSSNTQYYEEQKMTAFTFSFGIYASGLFSGVTRGIGGSASTIEMENKRQRDEQRRNTIEWKEN